VPVVCLLQHGACGLRATAVESAIKLADAHGVQALVASEVTPLASLSIVYGTLNLSAALLQSGVKIITFRLR
jgi:hypothetical protein